MLRNTTLLFENTEFTEYQDSEINQYPHRNLDPISSAADLDSSAEQTVLLSPIFKQFSPQPSLETRMTAQFKPTIGDRSVLTPDRFRSALDDTHSALIKQMRSENKSETRRALSDLAALLEENSALQSLLDASMKRPKVDRCLVSAPHIHVSEKQKNFLQILAYMYVQNVQFDKAIIVYKALMELFPENDKITFCLSYLYLNTEQFDTALYYADTYLNRHPTGLGCLLKGKVLFKLGRNYEAKETISEFFN